MKNSNAAEFMTRVPLKLSPTTDIVDAMHALLKRRTPEAPVVDDSGKLVGMLSETDCLKVLCAEAFEGTPEGRVADYMSRAVDAISPGTNICDIVSRFQDNSYRRIPVEDENGHIVGQVSRRDILLAFEAMRDNPRLYGTKDQHLDLEDSPGVDRAMKRARAR